MDEFDYVVVGGGSAGCVVASRLSEDASINVCLLEAGDDGKGLLVRAPLGYAVGVPRGIRSWRYQTMPQPGLNGRRGFQPRGKTLGGSSAINGMVYARGHRSDYDGWAAKGNPGWCYEDVLPYFRKSENNENFSDPRYHGKGGPLNIMHLRSYPMQKAAERIMWSKMLNAGQICTNVDYLLLPDGKTDEFFREARAIVAARYPDLNNGDYTAIIDQRQYDRLQATLDDALAKRATVVELCPGQQGDPSRRIMPPRAVLNVTDDMEIMQREIFGPLLPIRNYPSKEDVVQYIGDRPRPLALYLYTNNRELQDYYLNNTISGGVTLNDGLLHSSMHSLPFGGAGNSGMGHYHGIEGFLTFSKLRPVFKQSPWRALDLLMPPYAGRANTVLDFMMKLKR